MTRKQFIDEAKARGKSKEETRAKFEELDAAGKFDDSPGNQSAEQPSKREGFFDRVKSDIQGYANTAVQRQAQGDNPITANMAGISKSIAAPINEAVMSIPGVEPAMSAVGKFVAPIVRPVAKPLMKAYEKYVPAPAKDIIETGASALTVLPTAGLVGKGVSAISPIAGKGIENVGKFALAADMKIPKSVAKKAYGGGIDEQKQNIINDISKFGLENPVGNYSKMADRAGEMAKSNFKQVDGIVKEISAKPNSPKVNPTSVIINNIDDIPIAAGLEESADNMINKIMVDFSKKGLDKEVSLDKLIEAKRYLNADGKIFQNGPMASDADNLNRTIRKNMYLSVVDEIEKIGNATGNPTLSTLNRDAKKLIDIQNAAEEAANRIKNHSIMGIASLGAGAGGFAHGGTPEAIAATLTTAAALKAAGQGRLPSLGIKLGKTLQNNKTKYGDIAGKSLIAGGSITAAELAKRKKAGFEDFGRAKLGRR